MQESSFPCTGDIARAGAREIASVGGKGEGGGGKERKIGHGMRQGGRSEGW